MRLKLGVCVECGRAVWERSKRCRDCYIDSGGLTMLARKLLARFRRRYGRGPMHMDWRCINSPTGAHHWLLPESSSAWDDLLRPIWPGRCKWCGGTRDFTPRLRTPEHTEEAVSQPDSAIHPSG